MIVEKTIGNLKDYPAEGRPVDYVGLEWYELDKKLLRKTLENGEDIGIRHFSTWRSWALLRRKCWVNSGILQSVTAMDTAMTEDMGFLGMMQSLDAFFPVGAFTLSNGLEDYVLRDRIQNGKDLENYIQGFLQIFPYSDLGIVSLAYRNARSREAILELDAVGTVMKGASEVRNGSIRMGRRYMKARAAIGDSGEMLAWYQQCVQAGTASGLHSAAIGLYGAEKGLPEEMVLTMYGYSVLSAIVNNCVKLVPLSPVEGQRVLFSSMKDLGRAVGYAMKTDIMDLGVSGCGMEIHCMNHEELYSRQYMS